MVYYNFQMLNLINILFGMCRPLVSPNGKVLTIPVLHRLWSVVILAAMMASYFLTTQIEKFHFKDNLDEILDLNELISNVIIFLLHLLSGEEATRNLYELINDVIMKLKLNNQYMRLVSIKLYLWFSLPTVMFIAAIALEIIFDSPAFILLFRIPTFLTILHIILHMYLMIAILKVVNYNLNIAPPVNKKTTVLFHVDKVSDIKKVNTWKFVIDPEISFANYKDFKEFDLKTLCSVYDTLATCIQLLEKLHGLQMLFTIWLAFSSAVVGVTLISCSQAKIPWLVVVKTVLPYLWCYIGCYFGDQMRKEVERTEMIIMKHLIDFRCDQLRRNTLEMFKQLVSTNRLQFSACNLFDLSYSMILGMVMNIITYSIILIQLFVSD